MEIFLEKVKFELRRAVEYLDPYVSKQPDGFRAVIRFLKDSVSLIRIAAATAPSLGDDFTKTLADAEAMLQKLESGLVRAEGAEKLAASPSLSNSSCVKSSMLGHLVEIPKFGGDPLFYRFFMELFTDRVKSNSSLTDIEKFVFLKNRLEGEAKAVIDEIPVSVNNFVLSLMLLEEMYGDGCARISPLTDRLVALPAVSSDEIAEIRETYWKLEAILWSLGQYNIVQVDEDRFLEVAYRKKFANVSGLKLKRGTLFDLRRRVRNFILESEQNAREAGYKLRKKLSSTADSGAKPREPERSESATIFICENVDSSCSQTSCPRKPETAGASDEAETMSGKSEVTLTEDAEPSSNESPTKDCRFSVEPWTTVTRVRYPGNGRHTLVRLVICSYSRSKVSQSVIDRLGVKSFLYNRAGEPIVCLLIHNLSEPPVLLEALVVPEVCRKQQVITPTVQEFKKLNPHLANVYFPDTGCGCPIEMVIGHDNELASVAYNRQFDSDDEEEFPAVNRGQPFKLISTMFGNIIQNYMKSDKVILTSF